MEFKVSYINFDSILYRFQNDFEALKISCYADMKNIMKNDYSNEQMFLA